MAGAGALASPRHEPASHALDSKTNGDSVIKSALVKPLAGKCEVATLVGATPPDGEAIKSSQDPLQDPPLGASGGDVAPNAMGGLSRDSAVALTRRRGHAENLQMDLGGTWAIRFVPGGSRTGTWGTWAFCGKFHSAF